MAILLVFEGAGITQAQYDQVGKEVTPNNKPPAGMLYHVAAPMAAGGFRVIEVWESQAAADKFFQEKLAQALPKANIDVNLKPEVAQVHNIMKP
jgi:quinol monooxygenase YgiN